MFSSRYLVRLVNAVESMSFIACLMEERDTVWVCVLSSGHMIGQATIMFLSPVNEVLVLNSITNDSATRL